MTKPIVVIGGGVVGTAIAYELQLARPDTILVERDLEPRGATAFSFASLSALDEPQTDVYLLKTQGLVTWKGWAKDFGPELGVRFDGEIRWAESERWARHLSGLIERARSRGYPTRAISEKEVVRRQPGLRSPNVAMASFTPSDGQADPLAAIEVLRAAFASSGGTTLLGRAGLTLGDEGVGVRLADDVIEASTVVIASGSETPLLLERMGWEIPMDPSPGLLSVTEPVEPFLKGTVYIYPRTGMPVYLRQRTDGRVLIGERAQDALATDPTLVHARALLAQARRHFPALNAAAVEQFTVEWRPMPRDGKPIAGPLPGLDSVYVATGHSGITIAPALARLVTQEIVHRKVADRLQSFRPARFSAHRQDAYRSIEEAFETSELFIG